MAIHTNIRINIHMGIQISIHVDNYSCGHQCGRPCGYAPVRTGDTEVDSNCQYSRESPYGFPDACPYGIHMDTHLDINIMGIRMDTPF